MEDITDADYAHVKRVYKDFEIKKISKGEYHYLYVVSWYISELRSLCLKMVVNNLYGWEILQKLPVNKYEWIKDNGTTKN